MNYTTRKKKKNNNKIFIGIIIAISIIISIYLLSIVKVPYLSKLSSSIIYSVDSVLSSISGVIKEGTSFFGNTKKLNQRIDELEQQLNKAQIDLNEVDILKVENNDLKELLKINEKYSHFDKIYANVISRSYDNWNDTFVINKGKKDGIKEKQTVIAYEGLVGFVSSVEDNTSTVTTILDSSSAVSVQISSINALALVKGENSLKWDNKVKLINIPIDKEITKGETVYSSGIGELYKKGIPVGTIFEVVNKKNDMDRYAIVKIFVDITSLDMVGIIK